MMMEEKGRIDFCTACRKVTEYTLQKRNITKIIRDVEYTFSITVAVCVECGEEMSIPGLIDRNIQKRMIYSEISNIILSRMRDLQFLKEQKTRLRMRNAES